MKNSSLHTGALPVRPDMGSMANRYRLRGVLRCAGPVVQNPVPLHSVTRSGTASLWETGYRPDAGKGSTPAIARRLAHDCAPWQAGQIQLTQWP
jgi:hypothetical protein